MRLLRRLALAVTITVMSAGVLTMTGTAAQAATCVYWVQYNGVPVHENPDTDSIVRKWKNNGERVEGPCKVSYDAESALTFVAVFCSCATDDEGWMSARRLAKG